MGLVVHPELRENCRDGRKRLLQNLFIERAFSPFYYCRLNPGASPQGTIATGNQGLRARIMEFCNSLGRPSAVIPVSAL